MLGEVIDNLKLEDKEMKHKMRFLIILILGIMLIVFSLGPHFLSSEDMHRLNLGIAIILAILLNIQLKLVISSISTTVIRKIIGIVSIMVLFAVAIYAIKYGYSIIKSSQAYYLIPIIGFLWGIIDSYLDLYIKK
jgi:cation transport ATPase